MNDFQIRLRQIKTSLLIATCMEINLDLQWIALLFLLLSVSSLRSSRCSTHGNILRITLLSTESFLGIVHHVCLLALRYLNPDLSHSHQMLVPDPISLLLFSSHREDQPTSPNPNFTTPPLAQHRTAIAMSSGDSSETFRGNDADSAKNTPEVRIEPAVLLLAPEELPPATAEKLTLHFEEVGTGSNLDIFFPRNRPLGKAMRHFANYIGGKMEQYRFIFNGERLNPLRTATEVSFTFEHDLSPPHVSYHCRRSC